VGMWGAPVRVRRVCDHRLRPVARLREDGFLGLGSATAEKPARLPE
jgi:hypothetical protein